MNSLMLDDVLTPLPFIIKVQGVSTLSVYWYYSQSYVSTSAVKFLPNWFFTFNYRAKLGGKAEFFK